MPELFNIIPKPKTVIPRWVNVSLLVFGFLTLFLLGVFIYFYFQTSSWQGKIKNKEADFLALENPKNKKIEEQVAAISSQLQKFSLARQNRTAVYLFFDFLKRYCHPSVNFSGVGFSANNGATNLTGQTTSYQKLSEQMMIFKAIKEISNLEVSNINLNKEGKVEFNLSFKISSEIFKNTQK